jgi:hypothetical protein
LIINQAPLIKAIWTDTTTFEFKINGETIERDEVDLNSSSAFALPVQTNEISNGILEIYGTNNQVPVWRKIIRYRVVPEYSSVTSDDLTNKLSIYNVISDRINGWQRNGEELIIGDGKQYQNSMETEASLFVSVSQTSSTLLYTVKVESEVNYDFFKVFVIASGEKPVLIHKLSGHLPETTYRYDLSAFAGKNIELRYSFKTDEGTRDVGVTLKDVHLK